MNETMIVTVTAISMIAVFICYLAYLTTLKRPRQFEYYVVIVGTASLAPTKLRALFDTFGKEGWQLKALVDDTAIFERET